MASYGEGYQGQKHHGNDKYGNPVRQTGLHGTGATTGEHGIKEKIMEKLPCGHKQEQQTHTTTTTPVTGGSYGTIGEKIKEKLPGGHKQKQQTHATTPVTGGSYGTTPYEKKGMMDKIKDKLPGGHH